ncbi:MAG: sugar phosphate nucleotidyltransferase [Candidatus Cohnella colombiensis]|uniref:Sugar phosphate nucleotidyltransferase n=1 Tax=Candidatus Cohnella colombiensis TaxID=3121368 RepID=A0AA95EWW5_9BACL|nr:MAG: sugar phosphate nucleotidyltransferase [Cohnella sp.]
MKLVLLSGGSGKRLWPLSSDARSKQFLKVLNNGDNQLESMIQRVWAQLSRTQLASNAYIAAGKGQVEMIQGQLGMEVPVIVEPERRDTFPAIALAATYLYSKAGVDLDEVITLMPVDPFVDDAFFEKMKQLETALKHSEASIALMGVTPTYPSEKYGYIVAHENEQQSYRKVSHFVEKPRIDKAETLIAQQGLWNCGVFAFKLSFMIDLLNAKDITVNYDELVNQYHTLPRISFDYEVLEQTRNTIVIPYDGYWKDLGTWNTLTEEIASQTIGNGTISPESVNTHVINELDIPVVVLGLSNIVVSVSPDGILVSDKQASPAIKELIKHVEQRPMYEELSWGYYRVLDIQKVPQGGEVLTKKVHIEAGYHHSYQLHRRRSEVLTIISGKGEFIMDEHLRSIGPGDVLIVPVGARHSIRAHDEIELIEVQTGGVHEEEDGVVLSERWEDIPIVTSLPS